MPSSSSPCIVLMCQECGERTVLAGPESVWHSGYTFFECGCGKSLTLADRLDEQDTIPRWHRPTDISAGTDDIGQERGMFYEVKADAVALLQAMKEDHERHNLDVTFADGTRLAPYLVAERAGLNPDTLRYERAVRYLVSEGTLVWEGRVGSVPGVDFYTLTGRGLEILEAS